MNKNHKIFLLTVLSCAGVVAQPVYLPPGANLTYGASSNNQSIMSAISNPAAPAAVLIRDESQYRAGILSLGFGYEIGAVNDLFNQIDNTQKKLTQNQTVPTGTAAETATYINANLINPVNYTTSLFQKDGNFTVFGSVHVPFTPFVIAKKALGGSLVIDANYSLIGGFSVLADPVPLVTAADAAVIAASGGAGYILPANDSALLVKAAGIRQIGLGYSRSIWSKEGAPAAEGLASTLSAGELTAGARLKHFQIDLVRNATKLTSSTNAEKTFEADRVYNSSSAFGVDAGALWNSRFYRVGGWINNLNTPKFEYNAVDTSKYVNPTIISALKADASYEMKPQVQLEGAMFTANQNWVLNVTFDANSVKDPVGREFQWSTVSLAYATDSWLIPGLRVGYRNNAAGSQLKYVTAGMTLFKALSFDLAFTPEKVTDTKGSSAPRSVMANLGLQLTF